MGVHADVPFRKAQVALHKTTEYLALEVSFGHPSTPDWDDFEWHVARAVCALHGIAALLTERRRWRGPDFWEDFLLEQRHQTALRDVRITSLLTRLDELARSAGITIVALKGAALVALQISKGELRPRGDIDLLVAEQDIEPAIGLIRALGYEELYVTARHRVFDVREGSPPSGFAEHITHSVKIELHTRVAERLPLTEVDITQRLFAGTAGLGIVFYASRHALLLHLLLHAAGNMRARALRFLQLHDIAQLAGQLTAADWKCLVSGGDTWWMFPPMALVERYFPAAIPASVFRSVRAACRPVLRSRSLAHEVTTVSWSQLRISAFPGIEWSASVFEALRFMRSRVWPSRAALDELREGLQHVPWLHSVPWYGKSHLWRILRWLVARPPRVQTFYAVASALRDRPSPH